MKIFFKKYWLLVIVILFQVICNVVWLKMDKTPPAWDQAAHIKNVVSWVKFLEGNKNISLLDSIRQSGGYPPLIFFVGGIWSAAFGINIDTITFLNTLFLVIGMMGVYKIVRLLGKNELIASLAVVLFSFYPVVFDISRNFLLDLPLMVFVIWGLWCFIKSHYLSGFKYSFLFGLFLVLASLTKMNGFIYFIPLVFLAFIRFLRDDNFKILSHIFFIGTLFLVGVGWWWFLNFKNILEYLTGLAGQGEPLTDPMNLLNWVTWVHYFKLFFNQQAEIIIGILFVVAMIGFKKIKISKDNKIILGLFLLINYVLFTIIKNKDFRFTLPLVPVTAIIISLWVDLVKKKKVFKFLVLLVSVLLLLNFFCNSFEVPIKKEYKLSFKTYFLDWVDLINISDYPVRSPKTAVWPQKEILDYIENEKRILVLINKEEINDNNLGMYAEIYNKKVDFGSVGSRVRFHDDNEIEELAVNFDYILVPNRGYDPAPFYGINLEAYQQARDYILENEIDFGLVKTYKVFEDKKLFLYKKIEGL
jgi:4-amino-4-deoxy-L-arabinose transferase-like glycosyltransferase